MQRARIISLAALFLLWFNLLPQMAAQGGVGSSHIIYQNNANEHLIHLYGTSGTWNYDDLTALTGAPGSANGGMSSFSDSLGLHVFYPGGGSLNHVYQLYWQASSSTWQPAQDLTAATGGPTNAFFTTSFADSTGEHVFYPANNNTGNPSHIHHLCGCSGRWTDQDLTVVSRATVQFSGVGLSSFVDSLGEHVFYTATDSHIHQTLRS